jgi:cytochrome b561
MRYDPLTRVLHFLVAAGITTQMLVSLVMVHPRPGRPPNQWFEAHETLGLALLGTLVVYWLWYLLRTLATGEPMMLFPWFSRSRLGALVEDIRATSRELARFRLPDAEGRRPVPAAVQGLGLLLGLFLAASGAIISFAMAPDGSMSSMAHGVKELHEAAGSLTWGYLAVHPALGVLHHLSGHHTLNRMFGISR